MARIVDNGKIARVWDLMRRITRATIDDGRGGVSYGGDASLAVAQGGSHGQQLATTSDKREGRESKRRREATLAKATRCGARMGSEIEWWRRAWCHRAEWWSVVLRRTTGDECRPQ
ncbi:hypothetical protein U1Q18_006846 [Sarracenia purpurea var. burkii]